MYHGKQRDCFHTLNPSNLTIATKAILKKKKRKRKKLQGIRIGAEDQFKLFYGDIHVYISIKHLFN